MTGQGPPPELVAAVEARLGEPDAELRRRFPGASRTRQPVHSVYIPAHQFGPTTLADWGAAARSAVADVGGVDHLLAVHDLVPASERERIGALVDRKLREEPIEDLRIDFEDGYGDVGDAAEDAAVDTVVAILGDLSTAGELPPFYGIRFKSFEAPTRARGLRTLWRFVSALAETGAITPALVLTLPKVTSVEQVEAMVAVLEELEAQGLAGLGFEVQVETPQLIVGPAGASLLPAIIEAGAGRITGMPYGAYDYSASLGISAGDQSMEHPAADHAKAVMQVAVAGTAVRVSDGSTNVLPIGEQSAVGAAWALHGRLVSRSLHRGFYQGWDMHPAQLPSRYAATYAFFRDGAGRIVERLQAYLERREGAVMDEPATARAMAAFLVRGLDCGAVETGELPFPSTQLRSLVRGG